jgi:Family of unknown function (DUF5681)
MKRSSGRHRIRGRKRSNAPLSLKTDPPDQEYRVGPGRPPKAYQFKPGQSGNPKGARRKPGSIAPDLKSLFERALSEKVTLRQGEREKIITKAAAGIEQLVNQFAKGDRHARRDLLALAERLGVDLVAGQGDARIPRRSRSSASARMEPSSRYRAKIVRTAAASAATTRIFLSTAA